MLENMTETMAEYTVYTYLELTMGKDFRQTPFWNFNF